MVYNILEERSLLTASCSDTLAGLLRASEVSNSAFLVVTRGPVEGKTATRGTIVFFELTN